MPRIIKPLGVGLLLLLAGVCTAGVEELALVKVSVSDQRAVIRGDGDDLVLIKVGDRVADDWEVTGIAEDKVVLRKIDAAEKTLHILKVDKGPGAQPQK